MDAGFVSPTSPNLADFQTFLAGTVQIPATALPSSSPWPGYALTQAQALVLVFPGVPGILYTLAVYNCATHLLFVITPDVSGQNYFANARSNSSTGFALVMPSTGLVQNVSDQGTSTSNIPPVWGGGLTVGQLGFMKTPWGRAYLEWQQSYGPTIVALS